MLKVGFVLLAGILAIVQGQGCSFYEFTCYDGDCVLPTDVCDGYQDCNDGSDEFACVNVVGIAVGASIAGFVVFVVLPITICVVIWCCVAASANRRPTRTTYVATAAPTTSATVVTATSTQQHYTPYYPAPATYPAKPNAPPPYPTGYEPPPPTYLA